jgi:hypothetical protein
MRVPHSKPTGSYISSDSIELAKRREVFVATYEKSDSVNYSSNGQESYTIGEVWMERNMNRAMDFPETSGYKNILTVYLNRLTKSDLHEFRLLECSENGFTLATQREHPDGYPRIRFLLHDEPDTLALEVIERNPEDSLAWLTEKIVDTLYLFKEN